MSDETQKNSPECRSHFAHWAEIVLSSPWPEQWDADVWYEAMAVLLGERSPA